MVAQSVTQAGPYIQLVEQPQSAQVSIHHRQVSLYVESNITVTETMPQNSVSAGWSLYMASGTARECISKYCL